MTQPKQKLQTDTGNIDPGLRILCRIGGIATMILIVYSLFTLIAILVIGGQPETVEEGYTLLQENRIIGLIRLDLPTLIFIPLYYMLFLGLYTALKSTSAGYTILAALLGFVGVTLFLATPSVFSLVSLSDKYAAAASYEQRMKLLAAGETIMASDMWHSTSAIIGGILTQIGFVLISIVMLWSNVFSRITGYVGILTHGLDLMHILIAFFLPGVGIVLMAIAGPLYLVWFPLVGFRLLRLGRNK